MNLRFFFNPENAEPHIADHNLDEQEVIDLLRKPLEELRDRGGTPWSHTGRPVPAVT